MNIEHGMVCYLMIWIVSKSQNYLHVRTRLTNNLNFFLKTLTFSVFYYRTATSMVNKLYPYSNMDWTILLHNNLFLYIYKTYLIHAENEIGS